MASGWVVVANAPDQTVAEAWVDVLMQEGIPARIAQGDVASYLGISALPCRVLVPEQFAARAAEALAGWTSADGTPAA